MFCLSRLTWPWLSYRERDTRTSWRSITTPALSLPSQGSGSEPRSYSLS